MSAKKITTVQEHFEQCNDVSNIIKDANALLKKVQDELKSARTTLIVLQEYQHPKLSMPMPYEFRSGSLGEKNTPTSLIKAQVARINSLLGDQA